MLQGRRLVYVFGKKLWRSSVAAVVYAGMFLLDAEFPAWADPVQSPHAGPSVDGSKVYDEKCATCHNGRVARAPQLQALKAKSPEEVLDALLTGPMVFLGMGMPDAERRAVAEFITGKQFG